MQEKQWQNLFREKIQKAQTCLNAWLPQTAHSNLNITSAPGQQPRSRTQLQELPLSHTVSLPSASLSLTHPGRWPQGRNPFSPFGAATGRRLRREEEWCFRLQGAVTSSSDTSLSRHPCSSFDSKPFIIHKAKWPDCQTGGNLTFSVQYINGVNFSVTLFN